MNPGDAAPKLVARPPATSVPEPVNPPPIGSGIGQTASREPPFPVVRGNEPGPGNGTHALLSQPFIVENFDDGECVIPVVRPLKFLRFDRESGCVVDAPFHAVGDSRG